jgi:hypothetical protein
MANRAQIRVAVTIGNRSERNGLGDRLRTLEGKMDEMIQQETNQLSKLAGYLEGVMSRK